MIRGYVHPAFRAVADELERQLDRPRAGGAAVCVYHRGEPVIDVWSGARDDVGNAWQEGTIALSFSTTKGVMATLLHALVDRGLLDYDDPVAAHWPEFAQHGKDRITVRQVLCHQAGLYGLRSLIDHAERMLDWEHMTRALAGSRPAIVPGTRSAYHGITYGWLVGEIVRRVTRQPLRDALREVIAEPLGADGMYLGAPEAERPRLASLIVPPKPRATLSRRMQALAVRATWAALGLDARRTKEALLAKGTHEVFFSPRVLDADIPAFNGVFTARSLARMYAMLAAGGALEGRRFLSERTVRRATEVHGRRLDAVVGFPMQWRLGYHLVGTSRGVLPNAFGHFGYGGSGAWGDPDRRLAVAMTLNRVAGTPFGDLRMVKIGGVAAWCAERRRRNT